MSAHGELLSPSEPLESVRFALGPAFRVVTEPTDAVGGLIVRDEVDKIICRITTEIAPGSGWWLSLEPLRGYDDDCTRVRWLLEQHGFVRANRWSSVDVAMRAQERADVVASRVLLRLREIQQQNLAGALDGKDIEYLHDYRVAIRRTRAVLRELRGVFLPDERKRMRASFRWLQNETGPTRDLDVYLRDFDELKELVPVAIRADLDPVRAVLNLRHSMARVKLNDTLTGDRARELNTEWGEILEVLVLEGEANRPDAARPIGELAARRIARVHRRMVRMGHAIDAESPPERYHELRKKGKELRYLLELFAAPLFDESAVHPLVKALKGLQDVLGRHQDREVQIDLLKEIALEVVGEPQGVATVMAIGVLVDRLEEDAHAARKRFAVSFAEFSSEAQCNLVADTFS